MSNLSKSDLIGKYFEASIGEPWDFYSEAGPNKLTGSILSVSLDDSPVHWLLLETTPFVCDKYKISQVVGVNRYESTQDIFLEMHKGKPVTLNFMYMKDGRSISCESVLDELEDEAKCSFLVGSLRKITNQR